MQPAIIALLFIYSVCITVLFIKSNSDKKKAEEKLKESAAKYGKSPYGAHLKAVAEGKVKY